MNLSEQIELFNRLGLTVNQAKTYLALVAHDYSTVKHIAREAGLALEVVYRALPQLLNLGLVEEKIVTPSQYKASPINLTLDLLTEKKRLENEDVARKAKKLKSELKIMQKPANYSPQDYRVILIPERERLIHFIKERILSIKDGLDLVCTSSKFSGWIMVHQKLINQLAEKAPVRIVIALSEDEDELRIPNGTNARLASGIKYHVGEIHSCVSVFDNEALISASSKTKFARSPLYWSNNPSIVELCKTYFEKYWERGKKVSPEML